MYIQEFPLWFPKITEATSKKTFEWVLVSLQGLINLFFMGNLGSTKFNLSIHNRWSTFITIGRQL